MSKAHRGCLVLIVIANKEKSTFQHGDASIANIEHDTQILTFWRNVIYVLVSNAVTSSSTRIKSILSATNPKT